MSIMSVKTVIENITEKIIRLINTREDSDNNTISSDSDRQTTYLNRPKMIKVE